VGNLRTIFPSAQADAAQPSIGVAEQKMVRHNVRRTFLNQLAIANAAKALDGLPAAGESWHGIMAGCFDAFSFLPAILRLAQSNAAQVYVATLGFNSANMAQLFALLDAGEVHHVGFLFSCYYRSAEPETTDALILGMKARGQRVAVGRNHAKIIAVALEDGRFFTWEGSANMRSCRNAENYVLSEGEDLFRFHAHWIDTFLDEAGQ
jgi:hypothetical protein